MLGRYGGFSADMFLPVDRLLVRYRRQRPGAGAGRPDVRVAANGDTRPLRRGELRAEDRARTEAHARIAPGVEHGLRLARLPELHEPVVVNARIERDDRVIRKHRTAVSDDALRPDRRGMR